MVLFWVRGAWFCVPGSGCRVLGARYAVTQAHQLCLARRVDPAGGSGISQMFPSLEERASSNEQELAEFSRVEAPKPFSDVPATRPRCGPELIEKIEVLRWSPSSEHFRDFVSQLTTQLPGIKFLVPSRSHGASNSTPCANRGQCTAHPEPITQNREPRTAP